jgi:hypothetical protein
MSRIVVSLVVTLAIAATLSSQSQSRRNLGAPTYYIAANAEYRHSHEIWLRGASNLPAGAVLVVDVLNYVGEGSQMLGVRALPRVGKDGFFEATLTPQAKMEFRHNVVCLVSFSPDYPDQDAAVKAAVRKHGEQLGFPKNPQANIGSGDRVSLMAAVHVE